MCKQRDVINLLVNSQKPICIYGAGKIGRNFYKILSEKFGIRVDFFCDKDSGLWGKKLIDGIKCISPEQLMTKKEAFCLLLIGQKNKESALDDLKSMKIQGEIITFDDLIDSDDIVVKVLGLNNRTNKYEKILEKTNNSYYEYDGAVVENSRNKKIAIYTCITGGYEELLQPDCFSDCADYYCVMDEKPSETGVFKWVNASRIIPSRITDNTRRNRFCKVWGTDIFSKYEYSVYVDGNIRIIGDISKYLDKMNNIGFLSHKHAFEDCIYSEAVRVITNLRDDPEIVKNQMQYYWEKGMPRHYGMLHNAILIRQNNNEVCRLLMKKWWHEIDRFSMRDQLSLTYCAWNMKLEIDEMGVLGINMRKNKDFEWESWHDKQNKLS